MASHFFGAKSVTSYATFLLQGCKGDFSCKICSPFFTHQQFLQTYLSCLASHLLPIYNICKHIWAALLLIFYPPTIGRLHMTSHFSRQKYWLTKCCNLCWRGIGRTPTLGVILKTNEILMKNWDELLLVGFSETNKFYQKQFGWD